ncbi:ABC transporter permease [Canicola haemoglobinophilus]|uniref:Outer membrane-specific lipoprotein transporter subunit LolE n=1 Tax=Canicola haemoglobinophilus TaxID=733 RepID=A0A1V4AYR3_9PAST|nr:ABC transporter permease [Canicola haemoglobinophilus]STO53803.1 outer membrane-specific lipoprotein transporter subunit LolE [Canicola haemoglobinophilus]STO60767.1 outer membrane-specific lipoprotein transporter subunit LolE [Canicola haemoglobinophilus]STO68336.1 outer membrane-specific lipoprotein transporter subunit LolE [Canicola haemoglobinophilus]
MVVKNSMFWRLIFRALYLRLQRVSIIFAALTVGASIVTAMSAVYFDINTKMSQELRTFGANFYIGSNNSGLVKQQEIAQILHQAPTGLITTASPYLYGVARSDLEKIVIMGVWFESLRNLAPYWQITGSAIGVNFDDRNTMIGKTLAERLNLKIGDKITLSKNAVEKHTFNIKAIVESGDATDNMLIVNLEFAQNWLEKDELVTNMLLNVKNEQGQVEQFAQNLQQQYPDLEIRPIRKVSASEGQILNKIKGLMGLISLVILILATLCVNTTLIAIVGERAKEFALQKALGAQKQDIIKQIVTEILIIAFCAIVVGLIVGYILAQILGITVFKSYIDMRLPVIPITILLSLAVAFVAVIIPTRRALSIQTANILKGE